MFLRAPKKETTCTYGSEVKKITVASYAMLGDHVIVDRQMYKIISEPVSTSYPVGSPQDQAGMKIFTADAVEAK